MRPPTRTIRQNISDTTKTLFSKYKKLSYYNPYYVFRKRDLFVADVVHFKGKEMEKENKGMKYLLTCIDAFSKYAWVFAMKKITMEEVTNAFENHIFKNCGEKPQKIMTDFGSEFKSLFQQCMNKNNITNYYIRSKRKACIVERFNLTFQNILYKFMYNNNESLVWTNYINDTMKIYLNRINRNTGFSPNAAEIKRNEEEVRANLLNMKNHKKLKKRLNNYLEGEEVRIHIDKNKFTRGYEPHFSKEKYVIVEIKLNSKLPRYKVQKVIENSKTGKKKKGKILSRVFHENEIRLFKEHTPAQRN